MGGKRSHARIIRQPARAPHPMTAVAAGHLQRAGDFAVARQGLELLDEGRWHRRIGAENRRTDKGGGA
jgi:hypothetical protein